MTDDESVPEDIVSAGRIEDRRARAIQQSDFKPIGHHWVDGHVAQSERGVWFWVMGHWARD